MFNYIAKRGVEYRQAGTPELSEPTGADIQGNPMMTLVVVFTTLGLFLVLASIRYTLGTIVGTLAMVESPSAVGIVERGPPAYTDEGSLIPDTTEKDAHSPSAVGIVERGPPAYTDEESLIPDTTEKDAHVELMVVNRKPMTADVSATMRHLHSVGGIFAHWRGLGISILYTSVHAVLSKVLLSILGSFVLGPNLFSTTMVSILSSLCLVRMHLLWTHTIIAHPTSKSFLGRIIPRSQCKPMFLATLVFATAEHVTVLVPLAVAHLLGVPEAITLEQATGGDRTRFTPLMALRILTVLTTTAVLALFVLLPAAGAHTRVEAALLPDDMAPIVPIERAAITFVPAWRSFDRAARIRVLKVYAKMVGVQNAVALVGFLVIAAEIYIFGGEGFTTLLPVNLG
ncbi:hypothetical protein B0H16DRAFT_1466395 [Mycena metata]|uniref:Uncharacterized protein n=1 Tax=Mycena metata TaxID=1033252 RepID=A0AAD7MZ41_9AGAR|nr:hypothetical protein B0H16DRAFT_1466395 [Mycena metata]